VVALVVVILVEVEALVVIGALFLANPPEVVQQPKHHLHLFPEQVTL
jgi:hypothetical protein